MMKNGHSSEFWTLIIENLKCESLFCDFDMKCMKLLLRTWVSYLYAQIMHSMRWSLVRVQVATLLYMIFEHRIAFSSPCLTFWCNMCSIEITFMHEMGNLEKSDSEM